MRTKSRYVVLITVELGLNHKTLKTTAPLSLKAHIPCQLTRHTPSRSQVFFKGRAMSPAAAAMFAQLATPGAADKENMGNAAPSSPMSPMGKTSPASPASLFKKRPKALEMVAASNLLQKSSPSAAEMPGKSRPPRDSWVFSPLASSSPLQAMGSSAAVLGAVLGGSTCVKASSPHHNRPRDSILAFSDMSPLASTPTLGLLSSTFPCNPKGLFASQPSTVVVHESNEMGQDGELLGATASPSNALAPTAAAVECGEVEQPAARAVGEKGQVHQDGGHGKKKRKESILWFNDLSTQNPGSKLGDIDLKDAFADNLQLLEEEEDIDVWNEEADVEGRCGGAAGGGVGGLHGDKAHISAAPKPQSLLRVPSASVSRTWGMRGISRWGPSLSVAVQEEEEEEVEEEIGEASETSDNEEQDTTSSEVRPDFCAKVQVGPGLVISVSRDKDGRSAQRADLTRLLKECLLTQQQHDEALDSLRCIGKQLDSHSLSGCSSNVSIMGSSNLSIMSTASIESTEYTSTTLPVSSLEHPSNDMSSPSVAMSSPSVASAKGPQAGTPRRASSRAASPAPLSARGRQSERRVSPRMQSGGAAARSTSRLRSASPGVSHMRKSSASRAGSPGNGEEGRTGADVTRAEARGRLSSQPRVSRPCSPAARGRVSSEASPARAAHVSAAASTGAPASRSSSCGRTSNGAVAVTGGRRSSSARRPSSPARGLAVSGGTLGHSTAATGTAAGVGGLRTGGGMRSLGSGNNGGADTVSSAKTPMRAPMRANHA